MSKRSRSDSPLDDQIPEASSLPSPSPTPPPATAAAAYHDRSKKHLSDTTKPAVEVMRCSLPPHRDTLSFSSYEDYEVHYLQAHVNRCAECGKNFPTDRFLNLHIEENHDSLVAARRARGEKTYGCFVEDCDRKCSTPQKRRMHLIDKHTFPRTYNFYIINDGIDRQTSMLRISHSHRHRLSNTTTMSASNPPPQEGRLRRRLSAQSGSGASNVPVPTRNGESQLPSSSEMEIDELEKSMSALQFVPASVARNRGR